MNATSLLVVVGGALATFTPLVSQQSFDFGLFLVQFPEEPDDVEVVADLDLDGDQDLIAFATLGSSAVKTHYSVRLRDAFGIWRASPSVALPVDTGRSVAFADVDGDGFGDLVFSTGVGHPSGPGIAVLPGQAGGTFGAPIHVPLPAEPADLHVGDGNGDGVRDLLVRHVDTGGQRVRWILGSSSRTFPLGPSALATTTRLCAVVDADVDGSDDVAILDDGGASVAVLRTTPAGLAPLFTLPLPGGAARGILAIDWETDGRRDLFVALADVGGERHVRLHNQATWTVDATQLVWPSMTGAAYFDCDWNGDRLREVLVRQREAPGASEHLFALMHNLGGFLAGGPRPRITVADGSPTTGAGIADVNGDGFPDWVDSKAIQFGDGSFDFDSYNAHDSTQLIDWDDDGDLDQGMGLRNDGRGNFVASPVTGSSPTPGFFTLPVAFGDIEGDGLHEWIDERRQRVGLGSVFFDMRLFRETADNATVDAGSPVPPGVQLRPGIFEDADGDGDLDYVDANDVWLNNGSTFFTPAGTGGFGGFQPVAAADLDGDLDRDLLAIGPFGSAILVRVAPAVYTVVPLTSTWVPRTDGPPCLVDLDGDGDVDLALLEGTVFGQLRVAVYENQGGALSLRHSWLLVSSGSTETFARLSCGDLNGDGVLDLAVSNGYRDDFEVWHGTGAGLALTQPARIQDSHLRVYSLADLDQDGDLDLCGRYTKWNRRFDGARAGHRHQYGNGGAGLGLFRPLLSVVGPIRGGLAPEGRLRHAPGGTLAVLLVGSGANNAPSAVLPGVTSYVSGLGVTLPMFLSGAPGTAGTGGFDLAIPVPPRFAGTSLFFQALTLDAAVPGGVGFSNGCEFHIGS